jgi:hypothetical protein
MTSILSRWLARVSPPEPLEPGVHHYQAEEESAGPYRLHLRIEPGEKGILVVNAATVLHLNPSATAHALQLVQGRTVEESVKAISERYRVSRARARKDQEELRAKILTLATNPEVDPVTFLGMDRTSPYQATPTAPYRLDCALTYSLDPDGRLDPLARARVDRELDTGEWKAVLQQAWEAGVPHVTFTGGEPTRRTDLAELVRHAEGLGQVTGVLSSGRRLAEPSYVEELSQAGLDHFLIVLDSEEADNLVGLRGALASEVFTGAHITITSAGAAQMPAVLEGLAELGLPALSLSIEAPTEALAAALRTAQEQATALGMSLIWDLPTPFSQLNPIAMEVEDPPKGAGSAWLYVEPDADVLPSQGVDRILGNMLRDPWAEIWEAARAWRAEVVREA